MHEPLNLCHVLGHDVVCIDFIGGIYIHAQAVQAGSLPLPEGWSGRVVDDLRDVGSLEDMLGKQVRVAQDACVGRA